jgi:HK97 family phage major capsid protein
MDPIETQLTELVTEQKKFIAKADEEFKTLGASKAETQTALTGIKEKIDEIQKQADAIDLKLNEARFTGEGHQEKSVGEVFVESDEIKTQKTNGFLSLRGKDGRVRVAIPQLFSRKSVITTVGVGTGTTGVQMPFRLPGITGLPIQELRIRDLMTVRTMTTGNSFDYVKQNGRTSGASPQVEGSLKGESTYTWTSASDTVKTIAHFVNASRQALDDIPWLQGTINGELMYGLKLKEEGEILSGDGTGQHLNGLLHQATAYNTGLNVASDQRLDQLRHAKLQARLAGLGTFAPDGFVLNPVDMEKIELIKTEEGGANKGVYIIGDPRTGPVVKLLWGLPVVESDSIASGTFLVGSFGTAAELIDRMEAMIEISWEHASNFTSNLATILCEERIGLAVRRSEAFITGTFS